MTSKRIILMIYLMIILACETDNKKEQVKLNVKNEIVQLKTSSDKKDYLESVLETDQKIRSGEGTELLLKFGSDSNELQNFHFRMDSIDKLNLQRIDAYLEKFGYPDKDSFSKKATIAPWIVIHHSTNLQTRKRYFPIFHQAYKDQNIDSDQFELYLGRTYQMEFGNYPRTEGPYDPKDKINRLIRELNLEIKTQPNNIL